MSAFKKLRSLVAAVSVFLVLFLVLGAVPANAGTVSPASPPRVANPVVGPKIATNVAPLTENAQPLTVAAVFADVPDGSQFFTEISWLADQGISTGWTQADGSRIYGPLLPVNRDAMAAFMYRLAGSPDFTAPATSPFTDVPPGAQFYKEITWLADKGISTGWDEGNGTKTYRPLNPVNRDAMAAFMYRFAGSPAYTTQGGSFADVTLDNQFYNQITWLASQGISTGWTAADGSKTYQPLSSVHRDAMAAFMYRFYRVTHPLTITDGVLHDGIAGARYLETATATGGIEPLTWSATGLPAGLTFTSDGTVSGIPLNTGTSNVSFAVTDAAGSTATVTRTLNVSDTLPDNCIAKACAVVTPANNTLQVPASSVTALTRDTTSQTITAVTLSGPTINGTAVTPGQVLVLAPVPQAESGAIVRVNSVSTNADGTIAVLVGQATPADAYTEGTVNSTDPTVDQPQATPSTISPNSVNAQCSPGMTNTLTGLAVTPNLTPAMAAKWGWGGLSRFQFDLDGSVTINLGIKVSGKGTCSLEFPEFKRLVPAGMTGAIVLAATPKVSIEFSGSTDVNTTFSFKCGAEYVWTPSRENRTSRCSTAGSNVKTSTDLDVGAKLSAGLDLRVSWNDIAGITGSLGYGVDAELTPARNPGATVYLGATYDVGLCMACMWPNLPLNLTVFNGEIPIPRTYAKYVFAGPLTAATAPGPLTITQSSLPNGTSGTAYRSTLFLSGGVGPYTWALTSGSLPTGLTLEPATGIITGVPSGSGANNFSVRVTDSAGATASKSLTLTIGALPQPHAPTAVASYERGLHTSYAVRYDGTVWAWGENENGQLGNDSSASYSSVPVQVAGLSNITSVNASGTTAYAIRNDGALFAWGNNYLGQLGNGTTTNSSKPVQVAGIDAVKKIRSNGSSAIALTADGTLWSWGYAWDALGYPQPASNQVNPRRIDGVSGITDLAYTEQSSTAYAIGQSGTVWAWGDGDHGKLGNGTMTGSSVPVQVSGLTGVTQFSYSYTAAYALKADGSVWAWGANWYGQLGNGTTTDSGTPTQVVDLPSATAINCGSFAGYALSSDGSLWAWGHGLSKVSGSLLIDSATPFQAPGFTNIVQLDPPYALKSDGTAWAWGENNYGALGDGSGTNSGNALVQVQGISNIEAVHRGPYYNGFAITSDGSLVSWGNNWYGSLGDGTTTDRAKPVGVLMPSQ